MLPLNFGIRAHDLDASGPQQLITKLDRYNFNHIQLAIPKSFPHLAPTLSDVTEQVANNLGTYLSNSQKNISVLGCYVNLSSPNPEIRRNAIDDFKTHITLANTLGAHLVGSETGSVEKGFTLKNYTEEAYNLALDSVIELVSFAESYDVTVGIEAGINHPIHSIDLLVRLLNDVKSPHLKVILDCANLMSFENYINQEKIIYTAFERLDTSIECIHLKDFTIKNKFPEIVPVGTGLMNYTLILDYIKYSNPNVFVCLEATPENSLPLAINYLQQQTTFL